MKPDSHIDTIVAPATPRGIGGISVIRLSGKKALEALQKMAAFFPKKPDSHRAYVGVIKNPTTKENLDQVVATYFSSSYTGEPAIEISCHGNPLIVSKITETIIETGLARMARPGEFTYRAFLNSRMDLVQAESVLSLVHATSHRATKQALMQLQGGLTLKLSQIKTKLTELLADIEASLDFSHEDIEIISHEKIHKTLKELLDLILQMKKTYKSSRLLNAGVVVSIVGRVNVGKSSLLNKLLEDEKAIVSEVEGTTRDAIEASLFVNDLLVKFVDTAGFRETRQRIEMLGIEKTKKVMETSDIVLFVTDLPYLSNQDEEVLQKVTSPVIVVHNKFDLWDKKEKNLKGLCVSAKKDTGIEGIKKQIEKHIADQLSEEGVIITQLRQVESLNQISQALKKAIDIKNEGYEFIAIELKSALSGVYELLGLEYDDEVMDKVFSKFCIGK